MFDTLKEEAFYADMLELLPDPVVFAEPVYGDNDIITDFVITFCNSIADKQIEHPRGSLLGLHVLQDGVPTYQNSLANFNNLLEVYETGITKEIRLEIINKKFFYLCRRKFRDGVLSTSRDKKAQIEAEEKEKNKTRLLNSVIQNCPVGVIAYDAVRDETGKLTDFRIKVFNHKINEITGVTDYDRANLSFKEILKKIGGENNFDKYEYVVETGESVFKEYYCAELGIWLSFSLVKLDDGFLALISDISETKKAQKAIEEQTIYLNSILDASLNSVFTLKSIKNTSSEVIDFEFMQVNRSWVELTNYTEERIVGKSLLQTFPYTINTGLFKLYSKVLESGLPVRKEILYNFEGMRLWLDVAAVRLSNDEVVVTFSDITDRKQAELEVERQKNLLNNILKNSSSGISVTEVIKDEKGLIKDGRTIIYNDAALKYSGLTKEELDTKTVTEIDPKILESPLYQLSLSTLLTGQQFHTQYYLEETGKWLELNVSKLDDDRLINIFTDITNAKEVQLKVEKFTKDLNNLINSSNAGMSLFKPCKNDAGELADFIFDITNPTFAAYAHKTPTEVIGKRVSEVFPTYLENGLFQQYKQAFETGTNQKFEFEYKGDNVDAFFEIRVTKMDDSVLISLTDLTNFKKLQTDLEKTVENLKRSNESLKEFAYAASHDLQEPLRKISYFADRLKQRNNIAPEDKGMFDRMMLSTQRMNTLIEDLLNYSRVSEQAENFAEVSLNEVIHDVLDSLETSIQEKQTTFSIPDLPNVRGNKPQLRQLFQNLISNSIKYAKPGIAPHISLTLKRVSAKDVELQVQQKTTVDYNLIEVIDNGIGFEQEYSERIFKVFQRLHGRSEYSGTGVGLAIVKKVVEYHYGFIKAESEPGKGSTFKIYLPVVR